VFVNDTNNDDILRFPIAKLDLNFHNKTYTLRYSTKGPEVGLSEGVQKICLAAQSSDKKPGEI